MTYNVTYDRTRDYDPEVGYPYLCHLARHMAKGLIAYATANVLGACHATITRGEILWSNGQRETVED